MALKSAKMRLRPGLRLGPRCMVELMTLLQTHWSPGEGNTPSQSARRSSPLNIWGKESKDPNIFF